MWLPSYFARLRHLCVSIDLYEYPEKYIRSGGNFAATIDGDFPCEYPNCKSWCSLTGLVHRMHFVPGGIIREIGLDVGEPGAGLGLHRYAGHQVTDAANQHLRVACVFA